MLRHYKQNRLYPSNVSFKDGAPERPWALVSPEQLGHMAGELTKVMTDAAADYIARKALDEVSHSFQSALQTDTKTNKPS